MIFDWVVQTVKTLGYAGVAVLMFLENLLPPIPSELIMPLAGSVARQGELVLLGAIVAGGLGSLVGTCFWYYLGMRLGKERLEEFASCHGRWFGLSVGSIERADGWLKRHGDWAIVIGRLIPGIRTWISLPAGLAGMPFWKFLGLTAVGTLAWTALLAWAGWLLGANFQQVSEWLGPVANVVIGGLVLVWLVGIVRQWQQPRTPQKK